MAEINMITAINRSLDALLASDSRVVLLGEDIGQNGGVFRATEGLFQRYGRRRVVDTPLAESGIVGTAIGMAVAGLRPIVEIQFMGFMYPALDQLISHAGRIGQRTHGQWRVPMMLRMPYGGGIRAPEQHADSAEAYLVHTPGIKVVVPSTPYDAKGLLYAAMEESSPVIFLEPIRCYRQGRMEVPDEPYQVPIGEARIVRPGRDVTIITWGAMVLLGVAAAEALDDAGISVEVVDLRTLSPMDVETLGQSVRKTGRAVVLHEAPRTAGLGAEVVAAIHETAFWWLKAPVARVTGFDVPYPPFAWEELYMPSVARLERAIRETMQD